jgi:PiT family inorganic phosphate transporter
VFLGWALGTNDAANVFGPAVATRAVRFRVAAILMAVFICLGALVRGQAGMTTLSGLTEQNLSTAFLTSVAAALTVTLLTVLRLPISTSQAVVGAIVGLGSARGQLDMGGLGKVVACWIGTPIGSFLFAVIAYYLLEFVTRRIAGNVLIVDRIITVGLILTGIYGSYALGANNVANTVGVFVGLRPGGVLITPTLAALIGSLAITLGAVTYSRRVMETVGHDLVFLDHFTAFVATLSSALTVHFYAIVGVPVSTSQAIVGAVLGIGIVKGARTVNVRMLRAILVGWFATPLIALVIAFGLGKAFG